MTDEQQKRIFDYLVTLRDTGVVNMYAAGPYVMAEFHLTKKEADEVIKAWFKTF